MTKTQIQHRDLARRRAGLAMIQAGYKAAAALRDLEAACSSIEADRELFDKDEAVDYDDAARWLRQAAANCYTLGGMLATTYVGEEIAALVPQAERRDQR